MVNWTNVYLLLQFIFWLNAFFTLFSFAQLMLPRYYVACDVVQASDFLPNETLSRANITSFSWMNSLWMNIKKISTLSWKFLSPAEQYRVTLSIEDQPKTRNLLTRVAFWQERWENGQNRGTELSCCALVHSRSLERWDVRSSCIQILSPSDVF